MDRKWISAAVALTLTFGLGACSTAPEESETEQGTENTPVVETFSAEYEMQGTTSAGLPKNDTFIFEGTTTDGIITELNFDIIRNKGTEDEYSKKDIMGYMMNVSDASVTANEDGTYTLSLGVNGYDTAYGEGSAAQFMVTAATNNLTTETTFKDLTFTDLATQSEIDVERAMIPFGYVAREAGVELTPDTLVSDLIAQHGLYKDGAFVEGSNRISFAGFNGGRSYGEQIDAIVDYILANNMTLEDVYEMFQTVNQAGTPIEDRDTISGATISFVGDFQRMVYIAIHGELFQGVVTHTTADGKTTVEVVTQGYGGEIETHVTFDDETKRIESVTVRDAQESDGIGAVLTADGSDFLNSLVEGQDDLSSVETVSGATMTSNALIDAVNYALEYYNGL